MSETTAQKSNLKQKRAQGFRKRMSTAGGRKAINRRRAKVESVSPSRSRTRNSRCRTHTARASGYEKIGILLLP